GVHRLHRLERAGDRGDLAGERVEALPKAFGGGLLLTGLGGGAHRKHLRVQTLQRVEETGPLGLEPRGRGDQRCALATLLLERLQGLAEALPRDRILLGRETTLERVALGLEPGIVFRPGKGADLALASLERVDTVAQGLHRLLGTLDDLAEHGRAAPDVGEQL